MQKQRIHRRRSCSSKSSQAVTPSPLISSLSLLLMTARRLRAIVIFLLQGSNAEAAPTSSPLLHQHQLLPPLAVSLAPRCLHCCRCRRRCEREATDTRGGGGRGRKKARGDRGVQGAQKIANGDRGAGASRESERRQRKGGARKRARGDRGAGACERLAKVARGGGGGGAQEESQRRQRR
jgi:hypothetical protein